MESGRLVLLTSDHGHVLDRRTTFRPATAGERYRIDDGDVAEGEVRIKGARVVLPPEGVLIAPWSEKIRYARTRVSQTDLVAAGVACGATFKGTLQPGKTVRVHSGSGPESVIRDEDLRGADFHVFTDKDYVWNNKEGDTPALYNPVTQVTLDSASYDPNPPEGEVLVRSGSKLVPTTKAAYTHSLR